MSHVHLSDMEVVEDSATMLRFRLNKGWDYVWVTYHDTKGHLTITSSYGNYAYIWSSMGEGVSLREFFVSASADYLTGKLFSGNRKESENFCFQDAVKDMIKNLILDRREGCLKKDQARKIMNHIKDWAETDPDLSEEMFGREFMDREVLTDWNPDFWENSYGKSPSSSWTVMKTEIIPMIQNHFRAALKKTA